MNRMRRNYFIDKKFQTKFILKFCGIVILYSAIIGVLLFLASRDFTTVAIENAHVTVKSTSNFLLPIILETLAISIIFSAGSVIILTMFTSHKIAGPLYRIKREIDSFKSGNMNANFRTRSDDELQELARSLIEMAGAMKDRHKELKDKVSQIRESIDKLPADNAVISKRLSELEQLLSYFKI